MIETSEQRDERAIRPGDAGTGDLAAQHCWLVPEHQYLCVLGQGVGLMYPDTLEHTTCQAVEEGEPRAGERGRARRRGSSLASSCWTSGS